MTQAAEDFNNEDKNEISKREDIKNIMESVMVMIWEGGRHSGLTEHQNKPTKSCKH